MLRLLEGSSVGVAVVNAMIVRNTQINHADISPLVTATIPGLLAPVVAQALSPFTAPGRAALDAVITNQAQVIAYIDDYKLLTFMTPLSMFPLILAFREPDWASASDRGNGALRMTTQTRDARIAPPVAGAWNNSAVDRARRLHHGGP